MARGKQLSEADRKKRDIERAAKFKETGTKRLNNALIAINRLIPLANRNAYVFDDEQVGKIRVALNEAIERVNNAFKGQKVGSGGVEL